MCVYVFVRERVYVRVCVCVCVCARAALGPPAPSLSPHPPFLRRSARAEWLEWREGWPRNGAVPPPSGAPAGGWGRGGAQGRQGVGDRCVSAKTSGVCARLCVCARVCVFVCVGVCG